MPNKYVNGSQAYLMACKAGINKSYPTCMDWLKEYGLLSQPTGKYGGYQIDKRVLERFLSVWVMVQEYGFDACSPEQFKKLQEQGVFTKPIGRCDVDMEKLKAYLIKEKNRLERSKNHASS